MVIWGLVSSTVAAGSSSDSKENKSQNENRDVRALYTGSIDDNTEEGIRKHEELLELFFGSDPFEVEEHKNWHHHFHVERITLYDRLLKPLVLYFRKLPSKIWCWHIEALYIPAYRWEWGRFRHWTLENHERYLEADDIDDEIRGKSREEKRKRKEFIRKRRKDAEFTKEKHEGCRRIRINCSGTIFETQARTLQQHPETLLGDPERRLRYWNPKNNEYYFDRNAECFESILHYYQNGGSRLNRPPHVQSTEFRDEILFFDLKGHHADEFIEELSLLEESQPGSLPDDLLKRKLWLLFEYPTSSTQAQLLSYLSIFSVVLSTVTYCADTVPPFHEGQEHWMEFVDIKDPLSFTEMACVLYFVIELLVRFYACPKKTAFIMSFANLIDFLSILPFAVELTVFFIQGESRTFEGETIYYITFVPNSFLEQMHRATKIICVFRILKLARHNLGLRILGQTFLASLHELGLLAFFLSIGIVLFSSAIFFVEASFNPKSKFRSIPGAFFWAVSAMTTTGFDNFNELPESFWGKVIGSICAIAGVITLSMPIPVVVANFTYFYQRRTQTMKQQRPKTKGFIRACPNLPTCKEDDGNLGQSKSFIKGSRLGFSHAAYKIVRRTKRDRSLQDNDEGMKVEEKPSPVKTYIQTI